MENGSSICTPISSMPVQSGKDVSVQQSVGKQHKVTSFHATCTKYTCSIFCTHGKSCKSCIKCEVLL